MKKEFLNKAIAATLVAAQFAMVTPAFSADSNANREARALQATQEVADTINSQMEAVKNMTDEQLRAEMNSQAAQIESSITQAELSGTALNPADREELQALANSIRETAAKPHLKRHLFGRKLMAIPRAIVQGIGIIGFAIGDFILAPTIFLASFGFFLGTGDNLDDNGNLVAGIKLGFGITSGIAGGAAYGIATVLILGYAWPVAIATMLPIVLTAKLVCQYGKNNGPYTERFCDRIVEGNNRLLDKVWEAGENSGTFMHNLITHPLRTLGLRKNKAHRMKKHF